ncbi:MAG: ribonuclease H-like domain-containing protein [Candidatus Freyarchaeota archaeon]|nr:ribonuclease H-like domain-containing protein [Candidatus Jordarchaeia archaeon]
MLFGRAFKSLERMFSLERECKASEEEEAGGFEARCAPNWVLSSNYFQVMNLKRRLLETYRGVSLEEAVPGEVISTNVGQCYLIHSECQAEFYNRLEGAREAIISNFKFLYGIGEKTEAKLKRRGYRTIEDLTRHPKWGKAAREFLDLLDMRHLKRVQELLWQRVPKSHPLCFQLAGLNQEEDFAMIDIETMGLFFKPIILLGVAHSEGGKIKVHQYLVRSVAEEVAALKVFVEELDRFNAIISYNGRAFDIPFIEQRLRYYGLNSNIDKAHFDLLQRFRQRTRIFRTVGLPQLKNLFWD